MSVSVSNYHCKEKNGTTMLISRILNFVCFQNDLAPYDYTKKSETQGGFPKKSINNMLYIYKYVYILSGMRVVVFVSVDLSGLTCKTLCLAA